MSECCSAVSTHFRLMIQIHGSFFFLQCLKMTLLKQSVEQMCQVNDIMLCVIGAVLNDSTAHFRLQ